MPANYVLLERIELNASAASVTFSNIPQSGYTDLKIVASARCNTTEANIILSFNGSSANFTSKLLYGSGSAASSASYTDSRALLMVYSDQTSNTFSNGELYIPNYTSSNYKSWSSDSVQENNATLAYSFMYAGLWSQTAAINSVTLTAISSSSFVQYSTFSLYGLAAVGTTPAIAPKASGGNITTDGTYWYHTFLSTSAFVPTAPLTCQVLTIAGGGSGGGGNSDGGNGGGGGGAGGLIYTSASSFNASSYTVTVGAGGASAAYNVAGNGGTLSSVNSISTTGGGGGGSFSARNGQTGGSGGGGAATGTSPAGTGGSNTGSEGYAGGAGRIAAPYSAGGGGGAGAAGTSGNGQLGAGGAGTNIYSAWHTATYTGVSGYIAGGGGGGTWNDSAYLTAAPGGSGGGGDGAPRANPGNGVAGTINTGSGGGGGGAYGTGGQGGAGVVIIRYAMA
jgi:hypothetical protein